MKGDQFKPIDKPYMKYWQEGFDDTQPWKPKQRPTKELDKVVAQIKKGVPPKRKKPPAN